MLNDSGRYDFALQIAAPPDKHYTAPNTRRGFAPHSQEGFYSGEPAARIQNEERDVDGRYTRYAAASWIGLVLLGGDAIQYYPSGTSTWTSGNRTANTNLEAWEFEGKAGAPFTARQVDTALLILADLHEATGLVAVRDPLLVPLGLAYFGNTLWNHHEVAKWDSRNAGGTACPSGRADGLFEAAQFLALPTPETEHERIFAELGAVKMAAEIQQRAAHMRMDLEQLANADWKEVQILHAIATQHGLLNPGWTE